jgi:hypothetical protein
MERSCGENMMERSCGENRMERSYGENRMERSSVFGNKSKIHRFGKSYSDNFTIDSAELLNSEKENMFSSEVIAKSVFKQCQNQGMSYMKTPTSAGENLELFFIPRKISLDILSLKTECTR